MLQIVSQMVWALSIHLAFFTLILLQSSIVADRSANNISVGTSLSANINTPSWLSPSGDFAFGFHQLPNTKNLFLLAVWYAKIPNTVVWHANEGNPVPQESTVTLTAEKGLVLSDPRGSQLWSTLDELSGFVGYGFMNDTGNFALKRSTDNEIIWQSFAHPTDTLLPTQVMDSNSVVNSRLSKTSFTTGRFQMRFLDDGKLVLNTRDPATNYNYSYFYYISHATDTVNSYNSGEKVVYEESGHMFILLKNGAKVHLTPNQLKPAKNYYHRMTLDIDGVLTWYYHRRTFTEESSAVWSTTKLIPDNICDSFGGSTVGSGACGYNSICWIGEDRRPRCGCPPNYSPIDPHDMFSSCKPDFQMDQCEETAKGKYKLIKLQYTDWPQADYAILSPCSEKSCQSFCFDDCFCAAVIYERSTKMCWKKKTPLFNGMNGSRVTRIAWLKVGNGYSYTNALSAVVSVLLGGSISVNFFLLSTMGLGFYYIYKKMQLQEVDVRTSKMLKEYSNVHCFSYHELEEATNEFKEELGRGGFGIVYKVIIGKKDSPFYVAVKLLDQIFNDADKEFKNEVNVIGQTHHRNLVRLVGFCKEKDQRLLVYEYMSNSTLADHLFGNMRPSWTTRVQISLGTARGLLYLHEECSSQIIHCDIKAQNILLDDNLNPRISDFGLVKLLDLNQSQTTTVIRGTKGYVAPEWFRNKPVTAKVDVYSFGVLLLEIICCRRCVCLELMEEEKQILTDWAFDCYQFSTLESLVSDDMEVHNDKLQLERFVMVSLWCIQEDPRLRPTMRKVTQMLEGIVQVPNPPYPPSYSITSQ
ncbi:G-type lectin S-receptor-like serine/threonine-protein kinase LECRK3 [Chenopodium quinoa]|uniref:Receptor-like serine/threonine-protein kinase n=1 Tax=Chenopodium quinoa TaxID=63459 RepID=A0A803KM03_CHEQI|nr:G-type lectin S-receptor-like serine/threonine-protein kinase LECRK3 [Chenopodium quinoa]